jgi:hypothetical protein
MSYLLTRNSRVEEDLIDQLFNSSEKRLGGSTPHQMLVRLCDRMLWPVELWPGKGQFMHSFSLSRRAFGRGFSSSQSAGTPPSSVSFPFGNLASLNLSRFTSIAVLGGHSMKRNCCHYCGRENEDNTRRRAQANQTSAGPRGLNACKSRNSLPSPPNHFGFNLMVGPDAAPRAVNPTTGKRKHVGAIVIFAKQFHQIPGRRVAT